LDLPCGTGRLLPVLAKAGYRVTAADRSLHMVRLAALNWSTWRQEATYAEPEIPFEQCDVLDTPFPNGHFDAVVCSRLFHHFRESEIRVRALRELRRISRGALIVSFFNSFAIDALRFRLKYIMRRKAPQDRIPIPLAFFARDVQQAGLRLVSSHSL